MRSAARYIHHDIDDFRFRAGSVQPLRRTAEVSRPIVKCLFIHYPIIRAYLGKFTLYKTSINHRVACSRIGKIFYRISITSDQLNDHEEGSHHPGK